MKRYQCLCAVLTTLLLNGCASTPDGETSYILCDPSAAMVRENVSKEDRLSLILSDGSLQRLTVDAVDDVSILAVGGLSVPIETIHELRCTYTEIPLYAQVMYAGLYPVFGAASIVLLPVVIPVLLLYDEDDVDNWRDDRLCQVTAHPLQYGYLESGVHATDDGMPGVPDLEQELARRGLSCDVRERAEISCAKHYYSGLQFSDCVEIATSMEQAGFSAVESWSEKALCEVAQDSPFFYYVFTGLPDLQDTANRVAASAREQVQLKGLACPVPLGPALYPHTVVATHTACPTLSDLGR
ncbi:MAG: hypothetical protein MUP90_02780 [Gammaproteobacteria bacterium]|nr:hypothetical protein [Gammaproteobacteria bacterium]